MITSTIVLTAAHCVFASDPAWRVNKIRIGLDHTNAQSVAFPNGYLEYDVSSCVRHPNAYNSGVPAGSGASCYVGSGVLVPGSGSNADADVALLTLTSPVPREVARPRPVRLSLAVPTPTTVTMLGYGRTTADNTGPFSATRQSGTTATVGTSDSVTVGTVVYSFNNVLVTQAPTGGPAVRFRDSGGTLLAPGSTTPSLQSAIAGVTSYAYTNTSATPTRSVFTALAGATVGPWLSALLANPSADPTVIPTALVTATSWTGEGADAVDNCPGVFNPWQDDVDGDGLGDACDQCAATGFAGGDQVRSRFGAAQPNCNARVEGGDQVNVTPRADACDPYPCNPVDEAYSPKERRRNCVESPTVFEHQECTIGSYEMKITGFKN